jgi:large subunit ribosomal protein LP1
MGVFTFVCRNSGDEWTGKSLSGELEASAGSTFELQRKLVHTALSADSSGGVQSSFSFVTPTSGVFQVCPPLFPSICLLSSFDGFM